MSETLDLLNLIHHDAETNVLAAMRQDMSLALALAEQLDPGDFHDERRQILFEAIGNLLRGIDPVDDGAILAECRRVEQNRRSKARVSEEYLRGLQGDTGKALAYAPTLKRLAWLRQAGRFAFWLVQEIQKRPEPAELFTAAQERMQLLQPVRVNAAFVYGWDTVKQHQALIRQRMEEQAQGTLLRYDWPWASWNREHRIRPLRPGQVGILAAADGVGKTTYLEQIAEHWAQQNLHTVYVHLEDELGYKLDRRLARHAQMEIATLEDGMLGAAEQVEVKEAQQRIREWAPCLHYYGAVGLSMPAIVRELESRVAEGVCQAVIFDYIDKVQPTRGQAKLFGENVFERQAHDMEQLKSFAERCKLPVFTATQGNKSMQDVNQLQTRKNIQGSGQKSQKAQLVLILSREIVAESGLHDTSGKLIADVGEYSPIIKVRIDKQNRGKTGEFRQFLAGQHFTVRDITHQP
jgi:replicative DNA helicase